MKWQSKGLHHQLPGHSSSVEGHRLQSPPLQPRHPAQHRSSQRFVAVSATTDLYPCHGSVSQGPQASCVNHRFMALLQARSQVPPCTSHLGTRPEGWSCMKQCACFLLLPSSGTQTCKPPVEGAGAEFPSRSISHQIRLPHPPPLLSCCFPQEYRSAPSISPLVMLLPKA